MSKKYQQEVKQQPQQILSFENTLQKCVEVASVFHPSKLHRKITSKRRQFLSIKIAYRKKFKKRLIFRPSILCGRKYVKATSIFLLSKLYQKFKSK